jgi:hypothetical protein
MQSNYIDVTQEDTTFQKTREYVLQETTALKAYVDDKTEDASRYWLPDPSSNTKQYVKSETSVLQEYVEKEDRSIIVYVDKGDEDVLTTVKNKYNNLVSTVNKIPDWLYKNTIDVAQTISENLYLYADAMAGDAMDMSETDIESFLLDKAHRQYIDNLRKKNKTAYDKLVASFDSLAGKGMPKDTKISNVVTFFHKNSKDYIIS